MIKRGQHSAQGDQLITLRSSEGETRSFVAGLDWVASPSRPGRIDVWRKARSMGASAYVPLGTLCGYCVFLEGRDLVGLPSLAARLAGMLESSKESVLVVLKDQGIAAKDTDVRDRDTDPDSDSARFALIQIADGLILPTWDRVVGQEDMLSLVGSLHEEVSRILMDAQTLELLPDSAFGHERIDVLETDRLFGPNEDGRLQKLPFDPGPSLKLAVIAACFVGGLLWFFEDSLKAFFDPAPEVAEITPIAPATEIFSSASLLLACHTAFYETWQAAGITPPGFEATGVRCLADGSGGDSATGLVEPVIRYSWVLPASRNRSLYRRLAEESFRGWDYAVVTDRQAVSAFVLPVERLRLGPEDIPGVLEFRARLDQAFGLEAEELKLTRSGQTTLFVFRTAAGLGVVSQKAKALPEMEITGLSRDLRQSSVHWEISGRLAAIDSREGGRP